MQRLPVILLPGVSSGIWKQKCAVSSKLKLNGFRIRFTFTLRKELIWLVILKPLEWMKFNTMITIASLSNYLESAQN